MGAMFFLATSFLDNIPDWTWAVVVMVALCVVVFFRFVSLFILKM